MQAPNQWIDRVRINPQARLRLFCFPYAGGAPSAYRAWPDFLPPTLEVCAIQPPGKGAQIKKPPFTRFSLLIEALLTAIQPFLDRPFVLFGHSMGALMAFELARELRKQRVEPGHLFVSAHAAPHLPPDEETDFQHLSDTEFLERIREFEGTPDEVFENEELLQVFLPILRADFAVYETYKYVDNGPLNCPLTVFGGRDDRRVSDRRLEAWRLHTLGPFRLRMFSGGHFFLNQAMLPLLQAISHDLKPLLGPDGVKSSWV